MAIIPNKMMPPPIPKTAEMDEVIKADTISIIDSMIELPLNESAPKDRGTNKHYTFTILN